jgi:hypothetical protein
MTACTRDETPVSPEEIRTVAAGWQLVSSDPTLLIVALTDRLPGSVQVRTARARWIADTVSRLTSRLEHPASFVPEAASVLATRMPVSMDEMAEDRDALLGALVDLQGPLDPSSERAWSLAIGLFGEIVSSVCLDPFANGEPVTSNSNPAPSTPKKEGHHG